MDKESALYELRHIAQQAVMNEIGKRKTAIDIRIKAACDVLGLKTLEEMKSSDLNKSNRDWFQSLINERVMWQDLENCSLREITASIKDR
jgi:hypothetical protein